MISMASSLHEVKGNYARIDAGTLGYGARRGGHGRSVLRYRDGSAFGAAATPALGQAVRAMAARQWRREPRWSWPQGQDGQCVDAGLRDRSDTRVHHQGGRQLRLVPRELDL